MRRARSIRPTDAELAVLRVLWERGPSTIREVHDSLGRGGVRYTTTLKTMQNMTDKALVWRDERSGRHVYTAAVGREPTQRRLLCELLEKAFGGSAGKLVVAALKSGRLSAGELREIQDLLKRKGVGDDRAD
jgi:predicted transcriptional regulator